MIFAKFALGLDEVSTRFRLSPLKDKMTKCKIGEMAKNRVSEEVCGAGRERGGMEIAG